MKFKSAKVALLEINMTPMIDIVFQLIAFFMLVTNFEQTQADERVKLPKDRLARPPEVAREDKRVFNIGYYRDDAGRITDGPFCFYDNKPIPVPEMKKYLTREARILARDDKLAETTLIIRADKEVPGGMVLDFMKMAQTLGEGLNFEKFAVAATQLGNRGRK